MCRQNLFSYGWFGTKTLVNTGAKDVKLGCKKSPLHVPATCPLCVNSTTFCRCILSLWYVPASWPLVSGKLKMCTDLDPSIRQGKDTAATSTITDEWFPCHRNIVCTIIIRAFFFLMPEALSSVGVHFFGALLTRTLSTQFPSHSTQPVTFLL